MMVDTNTAATTPVVSAATPRPAANAALESKAPQSKSVETPSYDALSNRPSIEEMEAAVADISEFIQMNSRSLSIAFDPALDLPIVRVMDSSTDEVVRQIPSEEVVAVAKFIRTLLPESDPVGVLLNKQG